MSQAIYDAIHSEVYGVWFLIGAGVGILYAGGLCNGRDRLYQSKERRKHNHEKPDGLLYRYSNVYSYRFRIPMLGEDACRIYRQARL